MNDTLRNMGVSAMNDTLRNIAIAASRADWQQVVLNGGPPCFHVENGRFCLRAERWEGHGEPEPDHRFVCLLELLLMVGGVEIYPHIRPYILPAGKP